jgi:AMP nucleosidase
MVSDQPMLPDGIKTEKSDKLVTEQFSLEHLKIGIDSLRQLINKGMTIKHLKFDYYE